MKNKIYTIFMLMILYTPIIHAQEKNTSQGIQDVFSAKIGVIGAWLNYEKALTENISLHSELAMKEDLLEATMILMSFLPQA